MHWKGGLERSEEFAMKESEGLGREVKKWKVQREE